MGAPATWLEVTPARLLHLKIRGNTSVVRDHLKRYSIPRIGIFFRSMEREHPVKTVAHFAVTNNRIHRAKLIATGERTYESASLNLIARNTKR
jgi:hypothetical protein